MRIKSARVIVTCPGRNFVTLKIEVEGGADGIGHREAIFFPSPLRHPYIAAALIALISVGYMHRGLIVAPQEPYHA